MKKGFTLIEILGVVIILGIIAAIIYPTVNNVINDSKEKAYEDQKLQIVKAAKSYIVDNIDELPEVTCSGTTPTLATGDSYPEITVSELISAGYIEVDEVQDPRKTGDTMDGTVSVSYSCAYNQYEYTYEP